ncbi:MAG: hypothetical protein MJ202_08585 [Lentisphaeria bacterium]|nr:hypothetical protein [Lentisphaeria bacterium]
MNNRRIFFLMLVFWGVLGAGMDVAATDATKTFRWYSDSEVALLRQKAAETKRPVLVYCSKLGCTVCATAWSQVGDNTAFEKFLEDKKILGLKCENSMVFLNLSSQLSALAKKEGFTLANESVFKGKPLTWEAPWFAFVKLDENNSGSKAVFNSGSADVQTVFSVAAIAEVSNKNYNNVTAWLKDVMGKQTFKEAMQGTEADVDDPVVPGGEDDPVVPEENEEEEQGEVTPVDPSIFRWYGDSELAELRKNAALTGRPVLVYCSKLGCTVCATAWGQVGQGTKFDEFLRKKQIFALKCENSTVFLSLSSQLSALAKKAGLTLANESVFKGKPLIWEAPWFTLVKLNKKNSDSTAIFNSSSADVEMIFGVAAVSEVSNKTYNNVTAWLEYVMAKDIFKEAMKNSGSGNTEPEGPGEGDPEGPGEGDPEGPGEGDPEGPAEGDPEEPIEGNDAYTWYTDVEELRIMAEKLNRPVLVYAGKPNCTVCTQVWDVTLDAEGTQFTNFLKKNKILGFKSTNSTVFMNLASQLTTLAEKSGESLVNDKALGGGVPQWDAPWFAFVKLFEGNKPSATLFNTKGADVEMVFGVAAVSKNEMKNYNNITAWLTNLMKSKKFQEAFKEDSIPLTFWNEAKELGVQGGCFNTGNAVQKYETAFNADASELTFSFKAKKDRRYVFSVTAADVSGAPSLTDLQKLSQNLTCTIKKEGGASALVTRTGKGFEALDKGVFFEPTADGTYLLTLALSAAPKSGVPFALRYHYSDYSKTAGTFGTPLWKGAAKGKWSMDYEAAIAGNEPFILYFTAVGWCPHCNALDRLVFETAAFREVVADYPLVMVDNRRRGETTGPSLLYAPTYQNYVKSVDASADFEAKLAANHQFQLDCKLPERDASKAIGYPTLMLCVPDGQGGFAIRGRISPANYPEKTDFNIYPAEIVMQLEDLLDDEGEELDNYAAMTEMRHDLLYDDLLEDAVIGGLDSTDWRVLEFGDTTDWKLSLVKVSALEDEYADDAKVTLELYESAEVEKPFASVVGSWSALPELEYCAKEGAKIWVKITVEGQQEAVPYLFSCDMEELPPYDIEFAAEEFCVEGTEASCKVRVHWTKKKADSLDLATAKLVLERGTCEPEEFSLGDISDSQWEGDVEVEVKGLGAGLTPQKNSQDFKATLARVENCRVKGVENALLRVFTNPALKEYADGETITVPVVQYMPMESLKLQVLAAAADGLAIATSGSKPTGISVATEGRNLVVSGTPTSAKSCTLNVTLKAGEVTGATVKLQFLLKPLTEVNPAAANNTTFRGLVQNDSAQTIGMIVLTRGKGKLTAEGTGAMAGGYTLGDWRVNADHTVSAASQDGRMTVSLTPEGRGTGILADGEKTLRLLFWPEVTVVTAEDYLGNYNVSLESDHKDFRGYGYFLLNVQDTGLVEIEGALPGGTTLPTAISRFVWNGEEKVLPFYMEAEEGTEALGGMMHIIPLDRREDGVACVSACAGLDWWLPEGEHSLVSACGAAFDRTKKITEQLNGTGDYSSLNFYAVYDCLDCDEDSFTENVVSQLLPLGIPVKEQTGGAFKPEEIPRLKLVPGINLEIHADEKGRFLGSFNLFGKNLQTETVVFQGVFTPIPASCCSAGPDAIATGAFCYDGKTWPVRIVPDVTLDFSELVPAEIAARWEEAKRMLVVTNFVENSVLLVMDGEGKNILAVEDDGRMEMTEEWLGQGLSFAMADYGLMVEPTAVYQYRTLAFTAGEEDEPWDQGEWMALAIPEGFTVVEGSVNSDFSSFYVFNDKRKTFVQCEDFMGLEAGQAFFLYASAAGQALTLDVFSVTEEKPREEEKKNGFQFVAEPSAPQENAVWEWNAEIGGYISLTPLEKDKHALSKGIWMMK